MKFLGPFSASLLAFLLFVEWPSEAPGARVEELVAGAKREGVLNLQFPSGLTPEGARELGTAFNKKYGLDVKVNYFPSKGYARDLAAVITRSAVGSPPDADVMVLNEDLHAVLAERRLHLPFDYKALGIDPKAIYHENGSVAFAHQITLPGYNTKLVAAKDIPARWEDLLEPKWKGGKLGIFDARYFALLAVGPWGEKKAAAFVKGLAEQQPFLGRIAEVYARLELGEILVAPIFTDGFVQRAKRTGAPVAFAHKVEPVLLVPANIAVIKGAAHPNAAHLFIGFMISPEAQIIWDKYRGQSSALVRGTEAYNFVREKEVLFLQARNLERYEKLSNDYNNMIGLK